MKASGNAARSGMKSRAVYITRTRTRAISRNLQISNSFRARNCLTLCKSGTYTHSMKCMRLVAIAAALATLSLGIHAQGRERSMYVSVVDQSGAPVPDLGPADFVVKEDNVTREVLRVVPTDDPMQIAILVDTSASARDDIAHIRQALPAFVTALTTPNGAGRRSEVAIIGLGERPTILSEYSSNPRDVQKGIDRIWSLQGSGMYLLDAIIEVS